MNRVLTAILFLHAFISANAVNWFRDAEPAILEIRYTRTEVTDTTKRDSEYTKEETMLRIGRNMSLYCSVPKYYNDSLMACAPDLYWSMEIALQEKDPQKHASTGLNRRGRYWSQIYKNYPIGKLTETAYFDMEHWRYEEDWEKPTWKICDETKDIIGYQCFKAIANYRGRKWTAWFAPEIPLQEGPWKLCGLPGLILEAHDQNKDYQFTANGLKQTGLAEVGFLCHMEWHGVSKTSRDQFFNSWWKYKNSNFAAKMTAAHGLKVDTSQYEDNVPQYDKEKIDYPHDL